MANRRSSAIWSVLVLLAIVGLLAGIVVLIANIFDRGAPPIVQPNEQCIATVNDHNSYITLEQAGNVAIISASAIGHGLPPRGATLGIVTAWQESSLRNLDYGDRDSLGLFQQRPSQGWGTPEQIMDPWYASAKFYEALVRVPGWESGDINDVAQTVQRSGFPEAYRQHETNGRTWASALTGHSPRAVRCVIRDGAPSNPQPIIDLLWKSHNGNINVVQEGLNLVINVPDETVGWSVAQLAMLVPATGLESVAFGEWVWTNDGNAIAEWTQTSPLPPNVVRVNLKG